MRILSITDQVPRLPGPGTESRCFCLMRELAGKHSFTVLTTARGHTEEAKGLERMGIAVERLTDADPPAPPAPDSIFRDFSGLPAQVRRTGIFRGQMRAKVEALLDKGFDAIQVEHSTNGIWLDGLRAGIPLILVFHNVCSLFERRVFRTRRGIAERGRAFLEWRRMRAYERRVSSLYGTLVALSENERRVLAALTGRGGIEIVPNGVDTARFSPPAGEPEPDTMVYTGGMYWFPNHEAMAFFIGKILPLIRREIPGARLAIVGPRPPEALRAMAAGAHVDVVDDPGDARGHIARAALCVVPLQVGAGTRVKILEAMAMGKAIVSTRVGCEGLGLVEGRDIAVADGPRDFAAAAVALLRDRRRAGAMGAAARKRAAEYDYALLAKAQDAVYERVAR